MLRGNARTQAHTLLPTCQLRGCPNMHSISYDIIDLLHRLWLPSVSCIHLPHAAPSCLQPYAMYPGHVPARKRLAAGGTQPSPLPCHNRRAVCLVSVICPSRATAQRDAFMLQVKTRSPWKARASTGGCKSKTAGSRGSRPTSGSNGPNRLRSGAAHTGRGTPGTLAGADR